jgi:hypothetical protein
MRNTNNNKVKSQVTMSEELRKVKDKVLFPKKVDHANRVIAASGLPKEKKN